MSICDLKESVFLTLRLAIAYPCICVNDYSALNIINLIDQHMEKAKLTPAYYAVHAIPV